MTERRRAVIFGSNVREGGQVPTQMKRAESPSEEPPQAWAWWQILSFAAGWAAVGAALLSPLESLGRDDLVSAHVGQHLILGDVAAPLLMLGLPPRPRRWLRRRFASLRRDCRRHARLLTWAFSPVGALVIWTLATYAWYTPALHRLAVPSGPVHAADHISFVAFGMLIWLAAFDPREPSTWRDGIRDGGLPWWARHGYAMGARIVLLPPALILWFVPGYHIAQQRPMGYSRAADQANAAGIMIGFEMLLFALAFVLAFIFLAIAEGRRQDAEQSA